MTQGIKISRRTLAGATASAAFTCSLATMPDMARAAQERGDRISWQMCPRNCHDTCTLISHIRDGKTFVSPVIPPILLQQALRV